MAGTTGRRLIGIVLGLLVMVGTAFGTAGSAAAATNIQLNGTTTITLREFDYCGNFGARRLVRTYTGKLPSRLIVNDPRVGGFRESNPFHFNFQAGSLNTFGAVTLDSATTPLGSLQQHWSWTRNAANGAVSGRLINNGGSTASAVNLVNGQKLLFVCKPSFGVTPWVFNLQTQVTTMSGSLFSNQARITFAGRSYGGEYEFVYGFAAG